MHGFEAGLKVKHLIWWYRKEESKNKQNRQTLSFPFCQALNIYTALMLLSVLPNFGTKRRIYIPWHVSFDRHISKINKKDSFPDKFGLYFIYHFVLYQHLSNFSCPKRAANSVRRLYFLGNDSFLPLLLDWTPKNVIASSKAITVW